MGDDTSQNLLDFRFGFNDSNFSDKILRIEIVRPESEGSKTPADLPVRKSKRRHREVDKAAIGRCSIRSEDGSRLRRFNTLNVSSLLLAAKSPFFYKLFSNGMMESKKRHISMRINDFEEAAFMELLRFIYSNTLTSNTAPALLDVLRLADKFEVASCMAQCSQLLRNLPMTTESALLYSGLPSSILVSDAGKQLYVAAKEFLVVRYKNISECQDEIMNLSLDVIEAILSSDGLCVTTEDEVYDFAIKWTRAHYEKPEEQRDIFSTRLGPNIRFPYMTCQKLRTILKCNDFDQEFATKFVLDAVLFKAEAPYQQRNHIVEEQSSTNRRFIERAYTHHPIQIVEFELPHQECLVYLDLKHETCANLFPSGSIYSQAFYMMGQRFHLLAECKEYSENPFHSFGFYLWKADKGSDSFDVKFDFSARSKWTYHYFSKSVGRHTFTKGMMCGNHNLLSMSWKEFLDCDYFLNGVLHLRAELTIERNTR